MGIVIHIDRGFRITPCSYFINGLDSYISLGNVLNGVIEGANKIFTIGFGFRRLGTGGAWIFSNWDSAGGNRSFLINFNGSDNLKLNFSTNGLASAGNWTSTGTITDTNWHYGVCEYNNGVVTVYLDGAVYSGTSTTIPNTLYVGAADVQIGAGNGGMNNFHGYLNQPFVKIGGVTLAEVIKHYNGGKWVLPSDIWKTGLSREYLITNDTFNGTDFTVIDNQENSNGISANMLAVDKDCNENPY